MQIDRIYYPVKTLGYGNRIGIWTVGCNHYCRNCSNPELWSLDEGKSISVNQIIECVKKVEGADGITITGGDPFLQDDELYQLVVQLLEIGYEDILVYTGYTIEELQYKSIFSRSILEKIGILVDGPYVDELNDNKSIRGSINQKIYILNPSLKKRYINVENWERKNQIVMNDNNVMCVGLPVHK